MGWVGPLWLVGLDWALFNSTMVGWIEKTPQPHLTQPMHTPNSQLKTPNTSWTISLLIRYMNLWPYFVFISLKSYFLDSKKKKKKLILPEFCTQNNMFGHSLLWLMQQHEAFHLLGVTRRHYWLFSLTHPKQFVKL